MILLAFDGLSNEDIAGRIGCERHAVGLWRRRTHGGAHSYLTEQPKASVVAGGGLSPRRAACTASSR
jgi:hypothetical protein